MARQTCRLSARNLHSIDFICVRIIPGSRINEVCPASRVAFKLGIRKCDSHDLQWSTSHKEPGNGSTLLYGPIKVNSNHKQLTFPAARFPLDNCTRD